MSSTPKSADTTPGGGAPDQDAPDQDAPDRDGDAPLTRREMKERGIPLTSETAAIDDPSAWLGGAAAAAAHAQRAIRDRYDAGHAVTETRWPGRQAEVPAGYPPSSADGSSEAAPAAETSPPAASRGDSDEENGEASDDTMSTGRRPVVLAPLTARGIRTIDESGAITGVQAAVGRAVQSATSPASWESAVALPAVALGIADVAGAPEHVQEDEQRAPESAVAGLGADDGADPGGLGDGQRRGGDDAETDAGGHILDDGYVADDGHALDDGRTDAGHARGAPAPAARETVPDVGEAPRPAIGPRAMAIRVGIVLAILIVGVVVIYLISTGALGSVLAQGGAGEAGGAAGTLAAALRSLRRPRAAADGRPEEFCDR